MHSFTRASSNNIHPLGSTRRPGDSIPVHCISGKQVLLTNWVRRDDAEEGKGIFKANTGKDPARACATPSYNDTRRGEAGRGGARRGGAGRAAMQCGAVRATTNKGSTSQPSQRIGLLFLSHNLPESATSPNSSWPHSGRHPGRFLAAFLAAFRQHPLA